MTKAEALYKFFSGFGLDAYTADNVPEGTAFPYLTYTPVFGSFDERVSITVNVWYYTASELAPFRKMQEIVSRIKRAPGYLYDGGAVIFTVDPGWGQSIPVEDPENMKGKTANLTAEFISND